MHDQVDRGSNLRAHRLEWDVDRGHHHHRLQTRQGVTRGVGVDGRHRAVVAGVHRLQHVERLGAADLADQDSVRSHSQAVAKQLANRQLAFALDVGRTVLERDHVRVVDLQLGSVLDGDHALVVGDEARHHVQGGRLAGAGASGNEDVHASKHGGLEEFRHGGTQAPLVLQVVDAEHRVLELADGQRRAVDGRRPDDGVDAAAVWQARVDHRVEAVDVAPGGRDHAADRLEQLVLILETDIGFGQHAAALDEDLVGSVDHDLAHRAVVKEAVERSITDRGAKDDVGQGRLLLRVEQDAVFEQETVEVGAHRAREGERVARGEADVADEGEAVTKIVGELVEVAALARGGLEDVRPAPPRLAALRRGSGGGPRVDELHLQQGGGSGHGGDDPLQLGEADLERETVTLRLHALVDVRRDPLTVAKTKDGSARARLVARVGLERGVVDRTEDDVLDVAGGDQARAL